MTAKLEVDKVLWLLIFPLLRVWLLKALYHNAQPHTKHIKQNARKELQKLLRPAFSSDLSPIEQVLDEIRCHTNVMNNYVTVIKND
ncbi:hypothetical protein TNCV_3708241 [Trichonephila clavipes]|nr:hypothetical protein TNCV_3708241 [Trichonephila clavipes]